METTYDILMNTALLLEKLASSENNDVLAAPIVQLRAGQLREIAKDYINGK